MTPVPLDKRHLVANAAALVCVISAKQRQSKTLMDMAAQAPVRPLSLAGPPSIVPACFDRV
ncbi:MAG: hypothetical protein OXF07_00800, partial [Rhodobacter sp.]|nr:hypothetical protein [Rhodobacter sp.]